MRSILQSVISDIMPSSAAVREERRFASGVIASLSRFLKKCDILTAGSIAKGTFLKNDRDLDIFVLFPLSFPKAGFEQTIEATVRRAFPHAKREICYAEHPYVRLYFSGRKIDIVPAYKISKASERASAVDRSVLHTTFVRSHLQKKQVPQVLLLKKFLKSTELYGAEIKTQGFSGYLCELLILKYRSFGNLLRQTARWKLPVKISLAKSPVSFAAPLSFPDPVDNQRNVAAAVSEESIKKFILLSKSFLKHPSLRFFSPPKTFDEKLKSVKNLFVLSFSADDCSQDVLWGQIRKLNNSLCTFLKKSDFQVGKTIMDLAEGRVCIAISVLPARLSGDRIISGPPLEMAGHVHAFRASHRTGRFKVVKGHVVAIVKRDIHTPKAALNAFFREFQLPTHLSKPKIQYS